MISHIIDFLNFILISSKNLLFLTTFDCSKLLNSIFNLSVLLFFISILLFAILIFGSILQNPNSSFLAYLCHSASLIYPFFKNQFNFDIDKQNFLIFNLSHLILKFFECRPHFLALIGQFMMFSSLILLSNLRSNF